MLKIAKIELELISDPDMYIFFEKGIRGGISYISNRWNKDKNKYLESNDPKEESKHTIYSDTNNLYSYAMSKFLPTSKLKLIKHKEFDLNKYTSNSSKGCALEGNIKYPKQLRELHSDYPLAPDKIKSKEKCCLSINLLLPIYTIFLLAMLKN